MFRKLWNRWDAFCSRQVDRVYDWWNKVEQVSTPSYYDVHQQLDAVELRINEVRAEIAEMEKEELVLIKQLHAYRAAKMVLEG